MVLGIKPGAFLHTLSKRYATEPNSRVQEMGIPHVVMLCFVWPALTSGHSVHLDFFHTMLQ